MDLEARTPKACGSDNGLVFYSPRAQHDLGNLAERMFRDLELKDRTVHHHTVHNTFKGKEAIAWLTSTGHAASPDVAVDICGRLLAAGYIRHCGNKHAIGPPPAQSVLPDGFSADPGWVYKFGPELEEAGALDASAPDGGGPRGAKLGSIKANLLYKELAKLGKAAAQPFKELAGGLDAALAVQRLSLGTGGGLGHSRSSDPNGLLDAGYGGERSASGRGEGSAGGGRGDAGAAGAPGDSRALLLGLVERVHETQAGVREQLALMRLDLQQHTALQGHMLARFEALHQQSQHLHLVVWMQALLLLLAASSAGWQPHTLLLLLGATLLAWALLYRDGTRQLARWAQHAWRRGGAVAGLTPEANQLFVSRASRLSMARPALSASSASAVTASAAAASAAGDSDGEVEETSGASDGDAGGSDPDDAPPLCDFEDWPDAPLLVRPNAAVPRQVFRGAARGAQRLRINGPPIEFESELFKGRLVVLIRHLPSTPSHMFKGKKRTSWVVIQGKFKRPAGLDDVLYGQEFGRPFRNLPAPWFIDNMLLPLARKIGPSLRVGRLEAPSMMSPLITASQIINVAPEGAAPGMMEAKEDMSLFNHELNRGGAPVSLAARRKYYQAAKHRVGASFDTQHVWTFHLWQEFIDYASYMLSLGYSTYDLNQHLDGQPLQVMAKDCRTGDALVNLQVWHAATVRARPQRPQRRRHSTGTALERTLSGPPAPPSRLAVNTAAALQPPVAGASGSAPVRLTTQHQQQPELQQAAAAAAAVANPTTKPQSPTLQCLSTISSGPPQPSQSSEASFVSGSSPSAAAAAALAAGISSVGSQLPRSSLSGPINALPKDRHSPMLL